MKLSSTSSENEPPRSNTDAKTALSRSLLEFGAIIESIGNITSRAIDACEKGDSVDTLKLTRQLKAKVALAMHHNSMALINMSGWADIEHQVMSTFPNEEIASPLPQNKRKKEYIEQGRGKKKKKPKLEPELVYPLPENGREYLPREAATYLQSLRDGKIRSATMQQWITKRLVPIKSKQTLYDLFKKVNDGAEIPSSWGKTGRPRLVAIDAIPRLVSDLDGHNKGLALSSKDVEAAIMRVREEQLKERGLQPLGDEGTVSRASLRNYMAIIHANVPGISAAETSSHDSL
jgi:hypothetical protein